MSQEPYVFCLKKREEDNSENDWDRYSENIRPTRRGRKIDALIRAPDEIVTEGCARKKLNDLLEELAQNENPENTDEMRKILEFCSWFEENLPIGSHKLYYELLWKIISRDNFITKYKDDERMLKIWEKMADNSAGHAHEIYQFAISRKSLIGNASLYVKWSQGVELAGAIVEARRVLILARTNRATPLELINNAEDELEMREMRRHLEKREDSDSDDDEESRKAFTNLAVIDDHHTVPIVRLPSIAADTTKKAMRFDNKNETRVCSSFANQEQPFEVLPYADADDVDYLKSVHELSAHVERYAIKDTVNPQISQQARMSNREPLNIEPTSSDFEVWTVESGTSTNDKKAKARMVIKKVFKDMSFEEYAAQLLPNHPAMMHFGVKKLDFDETL